MCVIPVYYINAPGQNEDEYSNMHALTESINTDIVGITQYTADDATSEQSLDDPGYTGLMCMLAADTTLNLLRI